MSKTVKCGDCKYFGGRGKCNFLRSPEGQYPGRKFEHAPFWVWSDCYSDREQVHADVTSACPTFAALTLSSHNRGTENG